MLNTPPRGRFLSAIEILSLSGDVWVYASTGYGYLFTYLRCARLAEIMRLAAVAFIRKDGAAF